MVGTLYLLIVPYGIEIIGWGWNQNCDRLLIVPYGIEIGSCSLRFVGSLTFNRTLWNWNRWPVPFKKSNRTFNRTLWNWNCFRAWSILAIVSLLIVPYGIEILLLYVNSVEVYTFNRTLWNWNITQICRMKQNWTFNRTLWNWNTPT